MNATHGFLTLNRDRQLVLSPATTDEKIICSLSTDDSDICVRGPLRDSLEPTLKTHSILYLIKCAYNKHNFGDCNLFLSREFLDIVGHEVIQVNLLETGAHHSLEYESYVVVNSAGHFIMPTRNDGYGFKVDMDSSLQDILDILTHKNLDMMVPYQTPIVPLKTPALYSDVMVITTD